jgi:hypothetical protein
MSVSQVLALRSELTHKLKELALPKDRAAIIRINKQIASIDCYLKAAPPMMSPVRP